jgi:hypothetical protein
LDCRYLRRKISAVHSHCRRSSHQHLLDSQPDHHSLRGTNCNCQLRHQSWEYWRVPDIISSTSLLRQLALLLFFVGIIDLIWSRVHVKIVAAVITVAVGPSVLFILVTIALPVFYDLFSIVLRRSNDAEWNNLMPCAYRSPLSRVLLSLSRFLTSRHWNRSHWLSRDDKFRATSDWSSVDRHLLRYYMRMILSLNISSLSDDYLH